MFNPEYFTARSQDLEPAYHDAAQFYWGRASAWIAGRPVFSPAAAALRLPKYRVQDIDTPDDWTRAELLSRIMQPSASE
jgi:N-acylneuraminate cytidylyltransferase